MLNTKPCGLEKVTATFSILGHFTTYCNHFGYLRRIFGLKVFIDQGELRFSSNGGWCWEDHSPFHVCSNHVCPRTFSVVSPAATFASFKFSWYVVQINPLQETDIPLPPSRALFQDDDFCDFPWHVFQGGGYGRCIPSNLVPGPRTPVDLGGAPTVIDHCEDGGHMKICR